jgi:hypothetical protein
MSLSRGGALASYVTDFLRKRVVARRVTLAGPRGKSAAL